MRSHSTMSKLRIVLEDPKDPRRKVSSVRESRRSSSAQIDRKAPENTKEINSKIPPIVKPPKQEHRPKILKRNYIKGIDKILFEQYHPEYQYNPMGHKKKFNIYATKDIEIASVIVKLEERKKKFMKCYQKLFPAASEKHIKSQSQFNYGSNLIKTVRSELAEVRVPKSRGQSSAFYNTIKTMLEKVE